MISMHIVHTGGRLTLVRLYGAHEVSNRLKALQVMGLFANFISAGLFTAIWWP